MTIDAPEADTSAKRGEGLSRDEIERRLTSYEDCPVRLDPAEQGEIRALLTAKKRDEQLDEARGLLRELCDGISEGRGWTGAYDRSRAFLGPKAKEET
jgi:hypothetical protein